VRKRKKSVSKKRRIAAKKGWATRKAKILKRSLAAKRGWKTRKKNLRKKISKKVTKPRKGKFRKGISEGKTFFTPGLKYEYREFFLPDYTPESIASVIETVKKEPRPWPVAFYVVLEYEAEGGGSGQVGTSFYRFNSENAQDASEHCEQLEGNSSKSEDIVRVTRITMLCTYNRVERKNEIREREES
jgi:hypothetical protein